MRRRVRGSGLAFGLALLCAASDPARGAELSIAAPSACAIGEELLFRAERALGQSLESAADVRCTVHITRDGASYAARLEVEEIASPVPSRLRSFSASSCARLTETLALAVSLAIASGAVEPEPAGSGAASGLTPPDPLPAANTLAAVESTDELAAARPDRGDAQGPRFGASAALVADAGSLPGVGVGVSLGASLGIDALDLNLLGTYLPPRGVSLEAPPVTSSVPVAEIELLAGSLLACVPRLVRAPELAFGACAGVEVGWLAGRGMGVDVSRSGGSWWTAARADAGARWRLARGFGLDVRLSALVPWDRDEFTVIGIGRVFRVAPVVGRATLGLTYEPDSASAE